MTSLVRNTEELFLKIFKVTVLLIMSLALIAIFIFIVSAAYNYAQSPKEPAPAQKAPIKDPEREINLDNFRKALIDDEKKNGPTEDMINQQTYGHQKALRFLEEATVLYRCTVEFSKKIGTKIEITQDDAKIKELEELRKYIERTADGSLRGEEWAKAAVTFACKVLSDDSMISLKKEGKVKTVFFPLLTFHVNSWDRIQAERVRFEQGEQQRIASELASEALRVAKAKALAITSLIAAASAFGLFMLLAIYLLGAKIENNMRDINDSIQNSGHNSKPSENSQH